MFQTSYWLLHWWWKCYGTMKCCQIFRFLSWESLWYFGGSAVGNIGIYRGFVVVLMMVVIIGFFGDSLVAMAVEVFMGFFSDSMVSLVVVVGIIGRFGYSVVVVIIVRIIRFSISVVMIFMSVVFVLVNDGI